MDDREIKREEFKSDEYRDNRYIAWGNSWEGSYWDNAIYKAYFINHFVKYNNIKSAIEVWCWDWANLWMYEIQWYKWYDVSQKAIEICSKMYKDDTTKEFYVNNEDTELWKAELSMCIDMIYHVFPRAKREKMIDKIIDAWEKYVIFYTPTNLKPRVENSCMNDYDFIEYIKSKWLKYIIEPTNPPASIAKFITIFK